MSRVKFITTGHSDLAGNFSTGDYYTGSFEACKHFVEDAHCAEWANVQTSAPILGEDEQQRAVVCTRAELETVLAEQPEGNFSADQMIMVLRVRFGDLLTEEDEASVLAKYAQLAEQSKVAAVTNPTAAPETSAAATPAAGSTDAAATGSPDAPVTRSTDALATGSTDAAVADVANASAPASGASATRRVKAAAASNAAESQG